MVFPSISRKRILLISSDVMHYRVSVYNYFHRRFRELGFEFQVMTNKLQPQSRVPLEFHLREMPFVFRDYRRAIVEADPAAIILFLYLKDKITWPLAHWLRFKKIPFAFWTKGSNWDAKESRWSRMAFNYANGLSDALILYADPCVGEINPRYATKAFVANNTINFHDFPAVRESKEEIKSEFGIPFEKVVIFIGRMEEGRGRKRVDHLIDIFRRLDRNDIGLILVGSGLSDSLKSQLNPRNTRYLGEVQDSRNLGISKLCTMADVCAIPGHVGLGLNQAFHFGLPVVTEAGNHPPEIGYLKPGRNGFMVPEGDLNALQERLLYLLDNDLIRAEFSRHARDDIRASASIEGMFDGFRNCVDYLTSRRAIAERGFDEGGLQKLTAK